MYSADPFYKTIETSSKPISTCLLDQMKSDANFSVKNPRIGDEGRDLTDINQVFETLKSFEKVVSSVQDVTQFLEKASKVLQRTINIVDLKGGEQVFEFKSEKNVQAEPYHLCFVQSYIVGYRSCAWLSITCKNVHNTLATQMEPAFEEEKPDFKKTRSFSRVLNFFRK